MISYIVDKHHAFAKTEVARLRVLMNKVLSEHGDNHPELAAIQSAFESLSSEPQLHMIKEERVFFPFIREM